jgi:hypothetical protein
MAEHTYVASSTTTNLAYLRRISCPALRSFVMFRDSVSFSSHGCTLLHKNVNVNCIELMFVLRHRICNSLHIIAFELLCDRVLQCFNSLLATVNYEFGVIGQIWVQGTFVCSGRNLGVRLQNKVLTFGTPVSHITVS